MKYFRYILIIALACAAFIAIDNVYAYVVSSTVTKGSCSGIDSGFYDLKRGVLWAQATCDSNSSFYLYYLASDESDFAKCPSSDCTFISTIQGYNQLSANYSGVSITSSKSHGTIFNDYSYYNDYDGFFWPDTFPVGYKSTSAYYGPYPNTSVTPIINIPRSGQYYFTIQVSVLPGNQLPTIQSSYDSIQTNNKLDDVNQSINDVNDSLTSTESPDIDGLGNTAGWLPAGPVDSVLNLPLVMLNNLLDSLGSTCEPVVLPLPFVNKNLELPCINSIYAQIGNLSVWVNSIGLIIAALILYKYLLSLYQWVDDTLSFRENNWNDTEQWGGI